MAMDAAPALKRKDADAPEMWLDDGGASVLPVYSRATKIRRLDAEVAPVVRGVCVPPPPTQQMAGFGAGEVGMCGDQVPVGVGPALKRKGDDAPELWLDDGAASGFPVSSRATKIRCLDAEVPPVVPELCAPPPPPQQPVGGLGAAEVRMCGDEVPVLVATVPNEERAIVLYKPADAARNLLLGPLRPEFPLRVSPDWINGLKSTALREASEHRALFEQLARDKSSNLAMVPWVPVPSNSQDASTSAAATTEMMDAEDTSMEVEQGGGSHLSTAGIAQASEAPYHQWPQQQHCMVQQPLPAASYQPSPVTWSW
ncbi:hypothetical protein E2562_003423 [Oryza meyeriana var. granulata]|uniref:Uncharacterized protein n=1 Tax=Oryza meyeriana var. granulata TaxID=110450 RepID=A0A6G1EFM9_9ORYZ|nr:hypothetical protein E2562_003423 [Oryza meyeriana var. granulata]